MVPPCAIRIYVCGTRRAGARPETAAQRALLLQHTLPLPPSRSCAARVAVVLAAEVQVNSISGLSPPKEKKGGGDCCFGNGSAANRPGRLLAHEGPLTL